MLRATLSVVIVSLALIGVHSKFQFQKPGLKQSTLAVTRAEAVKQKLRQAYSDYIRWGFPSDEVSPLYKNGSNPLNGWGATLVDSLDTLFIMGLHDEFEDGLTKTANIDFSRSYINETVSVFETTIRFLGGILTAYELSGCTRKDLLDQAYQLGNKLAYAWSCPSQNMPYGQMNFTTNLPNVTKYAIDTAEAGTLILEFDRLSHYTGNDTFRALADKSTKAIMDLPSDIPGLPASKIFPGNNTFANDYITWGGGVDSYYEYLLKYALLVDNRDPRYLEAWKEAVYTSIEHLLAVSNGHVYLKAFSKKLNGPQYIFGHLGCFVGGNWLLGGKLIGDETVVKYGLQFIDTCMHTYTSTETGLGPEYFRFLGPNGEVTGPNMTAYDQQFNAKNGFYISWAVHLLRPEVVESVFYAWRMTGDERYQEFTWSAFQAWNRYCKAPASYTSILDVNDANNITQIDGAASFLYAETFKKIETVEKYHQYRRGQKN